MTAQGVLLRAAKDARQYFENRVTGRGGMYDAITIGRDLTAAINAVEAEAKTPADATTTEDARCV